jgi:hypothetical protein
LAGEDILRGGRGWLARTCCVVAVVGWPGHAAWWPWLAGQDIE